MTQKKTRTSTKRHRWTDESLATLRHLYPDHTADVVAKVIGCSVGSVYARAHALDLGKSPTFNAHWVHPAAVASQFKPGQKPWNAGQQGYKPGGRAADTQFRPGNKPHTTLPVGSYRLCTCSHTGRKILEQKVREATGPNHKRWTPVARLVWEAANGPVPAGHIVVFRPGMFANELEHITLDKVECITRAQNAARNHPRNKHPELARLVAIKGAITRQVNRITREHNEQRQGATP